MAAITIATSGATAQRHIADDDIARVLAAYRATLGDGMSDADILAAIVGGFAATVASVVSEHERAVAAAQAVASVQPIAVT